MVWVQKEQLVVLFVVSYKSVVKDCWLERKLARNRTILHLKLSISHTKTCCNLFGMA